MELTSMRRRGWSMLLAVMWLAGCTSTHTIHGSVQPTVFPTPFHQTTLPSCPSMLVALDDRTSATGIILSFYNAINRQELTRAYRYLSPLSPLATPTPGPSTAPTPTSTPALPDFAAWVQGYANTACVIVTYHGAETDVTSSNTGYAGIGRGKLVPVSLTAVAKDGTLQQFAGMYAVRFDPAQGIATTGYIASNFSRLTQIG